jgi:hypothetical protein
MLHIVDHSAHGAENAGEGWTDKTDGYEKQKDAIAKSEKSLHGEGVFSKLDLAAQRYAGRLEGLMEGEIQDGHLKVAATTATSDPAT